MNICEQIKALPDDLNNPTLVAEYILARMDDPNRMEVSKLKALAESHERLLHAARQWVKECRIEFSEEEIANDPEIQLLDAAIEQAEKL